jgi:UDP-glucuronate 4-epimerase
MNLKKPFSTDDRADYPISLYAATKRSNELMAHTYSHLYGIPTTGLRFFTVYGPYGRPDMAYYKFTKSILNGEPIDVYNNGIMKRDFTYIDDIISGILSVINATPTSKTNIYTSASSSHQLFNIGNNDPVSLRDFISAIEYSCGKKALENKMPMQPGDVSETYADINPLIDAFDFRPSTSINVGISKFVSWYRKKVHACN